MSYKRQYYTNGNVLNAEQLNHMEAGIKENSDNIGKLSEEIEDIEYATIGRRLYKVANGKYYNTGGYFVESANGYTTDFIDVSVYKKIEYVANISDAGYEIAFFDANKVLDIEHSVAGRKSNEVRVIDIPTGTKYAIVSSYDNPSAYMLAITDNEKAYDVRLDGLEEKVDNLEITPKQTTFFTVFNLSDGLIYQAGKYINGEGRIQSTSIGKTFFFNAEPNTKYYIYIPKRNRWHVASFNTHDTDVDKTGIIIDDVELPTIKEITTLNDTVMVGVYFCSGDYDYEGNKGDIKLYKGEWHSSDTPQIKKEYLPKHHYNTFSVIGDSYSTFSGYLADENALSWYPPSSSAQDTNDVRKVEDTWWYKFANMYESRLIDNNSWSGSTIGYDGYGSGTSDAKVSSFVNRVDKFTHPELVIIFGGTNDEWASNESGRGDDILGEYKYSDWTETDLTYFRPALACLIEKIKHKCIGAKIIFVLNTDLSRITPSVDEICNHYDIAVLHLDNIDKAHSHPTIKGMTSIAEQIINFVNS